MKKNNTAVAMLACLIAMTAGCAVMRIDVDVYKGPLANHEDVQRKQLAALAVGAKPLLIQLRDNLLWLDKCRGATLPWVPDSGDSVPTHAPSDDVLTCRAYAIREADQLGFVFRPDRAISTPPVWASAQARRVNAVLSLYDHRGDLGIAGFVERLNRLQGVLAAATAAYAETPEDKAAADTVAEAVRKLSPLVTKDTKDLKIEFGESLTNFLLGGGLPAFEKTLKPASPNNKDGNAALSRSLNERQIAVLASAEQVQKETESLFPNDKPKGQMISTHVGRRLSKQKAAEMQQPDAIRSVWEDALSQLIRLDKQKRSVEEEVTIQAIARLTSELTDVSRMTVALRLEDVATPPSLTAAIWKSAQCAEPLSSESLVGAKKELATWLKKEPGKGAEFLSQLDTTLRRASEERLKHLCPSADIPQLKDGLAIPSFTRGGGKQALEVLAEARKTVETSALGILSAEGLDKGRPDEGLDELIESFLKQLDKTAGKERTAETSALFDELERAQQQLDNALIGFSEKMLVLADNDELLSVAASPQGKANKLDQYVLVLQSIGNSILVSVDEMNNRASHDAKQRVRSASERGALDAAIGRSRGDTLDDLLKDLDAQASKAAGDRDSARTASEQLDATIQRLDSDLAQKKQERTNAETALAEKQRLYFERLNRLRPALNAYRLAGESVATSDPAIAALPELGEPASSLGTDTRRLEQELDQLLTTTTGIQASALKQDVITWLNKQPIHSSFACPQFNDQPEVSSPRKIKLSCALEFWNHPEENFTRATDSIQAGDGGKTWRAVLDALGHFYNFMLGDLQPAFNARSAAERAVGALNNDIAKLETNRSKEAAKAVQAKQDLKSKDDASTIAHNAAAAAREFAPKALVEAQSLGLGGGPTYGLLLSTIGQAQQASSDARKEFLASALVGLSKRNPPIDAAIPKVPRPNGKGETQRDVLDDLIALLRYEQVLATRESGDSGRAKQIELALKLAYDQRSGMAYIRPPSAYLRTSNAATLLQNDPRLGWENMLSKHAWRSIGDATNKEKEDRLAIISNLDKQFWQNINSVRLAGSGNTNYAIAKDDIGNWYAKAFSTDPTPIIRSAQRLALFSMGGSLDANLLGQLDLQNKIDLGKGTEKDAAQLEALRKQGPKGDSPALGRVLDRYQADYAAKTKQDATELTQRLEGGALQKQITAAWQASVSFPDDEKGDRKAAFLTRLQAAMTAEAAGPLDAALEQLKQADRAAASTKPADASVAPVGSASTPSANQARRILSALRNVLRFDTLLSARVTQVDLSQETADLRNAEAQLRTREEQAAAARTRRDKIRGELDTQQAVLSAMENTTSSGQTHDQRTKDKRTEVDGLRTQLAEAETQLKTDQEAVETARKSAVSARAINEAALHSRDMAAKDVSRVAGGLVLEFANRRQQTVAGFEQAILVVGEASKQ